MRSSSFLTLSLIVTGTFRGGWTTGRVDLDLMCNACDATQASEAVGHLTLFTRFNSVIVWGPSTLDTWSRTSNSTGIYFFLYSHKMVHFPSGRSRWPPNATSLARDFLRVCCPSFLLKGRCQCRFWMQRVCRWPLRLRANLLWGLCGCQGCQWPCRCRLSSSSRSFGLAFVILERRQNGFCAHSYDRLFQLLDIFAEVNVLYRSFRTVVSPWHWDRLVFCLSFENFEIEVFFAKIGEQLSKNISKVSSSELNKETWNSHTPQYCSFSTLLCCQLMQAPKAWEQYSCKMADQSHTHPNPSQPANATMHKSRRKCSPLCSDALSSTTTYTDSQTWMWKLTTNPSNLSHYIKHPLASKEW